MTILNGLLSIIIFLSCFTIIYFSLEKIFSIKSVINFGLPVALINLIFGLVLGVATAFAEHVISINTKDNGVFIIAITIVLLTFFKNWKLALYSLLFPLIYTLVYDNIDSIIYFKIINIFIIILTSYISKFILPEKWKWVPLIIILLLLIFVSLALSYLYFPASKLLLNLEGTCFTYLWSIFAFFIFYFLVQFTISSKILFESSNYAFLNYYHSGLANREITNKIFLEKIDKGILAIFEINIINKNLTNIQKNEIRETVLEKISEGEQNENWILFFVPDNKYGFFLKNDIEPNDIKHKITQIINFISKKYRTSWGSIEDVEIKIGIALYGLHDNSISTLIPYALYALKTIHQKDSINIFDSNLYMKSISEHRQLTLMDKALTLDDYKNDFYELWNISEGVKPFGLRVKVQNVSEILWWETIDEMLYIKNWSRMFSRYFAQYAITQVEDIKIIMDYDVSVFEHDFYIEDFINQIKANKIQTKNIYIVVKNFDLIGIRNISLVKKIAMKLSTDYGINFVKGKRHTSEMFKKIFPSSKYVLYDGKDQKIKNKILINDSAKNVQDIFSSFKANVQIIGGPITKTNFLSHIFNKKSKMLIEQSLDKGVKSVK